MNDEVIAEKLAAIPVLLDAAPSLLRRGRHLTVDCLIAIGGIEFHARFRNGQLTLARGLKLMQPWRFAIRASADAWQRHWASVPEPEWHDLLALTKSGAIIVEGDLYPFMANLQFIKDVLALPRAASVQPSAAAQTAVGEPHFEPIAGRYLTLDISGVRHRVYFEEAGQGIPLVCLHTAGADTRQFRNLMNDPAVTEHFRVLAFDLPWHGKSSPPEGWQHTEYRLTTQSYTAAIRTFCAALGLDRPVVMGCSIGGRIVLNLAIAHAAEFRALIGLESADFQSPWYDTEWLHRPDIHGGEICAALISGLVAPQIGDTDRFETLWHYMQSGPGIFKGDLHFYRVDGDLRGRTAAIDTARCPLFLLTGRYDFSCTPADTIRTAAAIPGAEVTIMEGLGHFPMSEDHARFRSYLLPVLSRIRALGSA